MVSRIVLSLITIALLCSIVTAQQRAKSCDIEYSKEFDLYPQLAHKAVTTKSVYGRMTDEHNRAIPGVCIGLFTEKGHRLAASVESDDDGHFRFGGIAPGRYQLVSRVPGFYLKMIPVRIVGWPHSWFLKSKSILLYMEIPEIN